MALAVAVLDSVSDAVVGTDASKIAFFEDIRGKYILVYYPNVSGVGGNERVEVVNVTNGGAKSVCFCKKPIYWQHGKWIWNRSG